jgi:aminomethyltransferase
MEIKTKLAKSPLHDWHIAHGATVMWDDNYPWTYTQGPTEDYMNEYEAVRNGTGLLDLFSLVVYEVTGRDAVPFIQRTFTNIVETMEAGQVRYGAFVNRMGIMMDEGSIFKFSPERFILIANGPNLGWQMREYAEGLDAAIENITDKRSTIGVQGPTSLETLQSLVDKDISGLRFFRFDPEEVEIAGCKGWISRTGYSGEKGYEVNIAPEDTVKVWEALIEKGAVPFGVYAIEVLRVEAGLLLIYIDYRLNDISPFDLSMDSCIKFHPDCVGTEALKEYQKILPRRFKSIKIEGGELPDFHTGVYANGEPVGLVKSVANSPICGCIALAMIDTPFAGDGTKVDVQIDGKFVPAEVAPLSVFDPEKKRLRG